MERTAGQKGGTSSSSTPRNFFPYDRLGALSRKTDLSKNHLQECSLNKFRPFDRPGRTESHAGQKEISLFERTVL